MTKRFAGQVVVCKDGNHIAGYLVPHGGEGESFLLGTMIESPNPRHLESFRRLMVVIAQDLIEEASGGPASADPFDVPGGHA